VAFLTASVEFVDVGFASNLNNTTSYVIPVAYHPYVPYMVFIWIMMFFICIVNIYRIWLRNLKEAGTQQKNKYQV
jgi:hypothetical protein